MASAKGKGGKAGVASDSGCQASRAGKAEGKTLAPMMAVSLKRRNAGENTLVSGWLKLTGEPQGREAVTRLWKLGAFTDTTADVCCQNTAVSFSNRKTESDVCFVC